MARGRVNNDRIFFFGLTVPLRLDLSLLSHKDPGPKWMGTLTKFKKKKMH